MPELKFETGLVEYDLNGVYKVRFNPTDPAFAERVCDVFESLAMKQKTHEEEAKKTGNNREFFDEAEELNSEMRNMIDGILGDSACDTLFGEMNVYAFGDGLPAWMNLLLAIMDEINAKVEKEGKLINPRIAKYTSKYHK